MKISKPKIYNKDNKEIVPPEGATGFVMGMKAMQWTFDNGNSEFIYVPSPLKKILCSKCNEMKDEAPGYINLLDEGKFICYDC